MGISLGRSDPTDVQKPASPFSFIRGILKPMDEHDPSLKPLVQQRIPEVANLLRQRQKSIIGRWTDLVRDQLPDADPLTLGQVRDSIPRVLQTIADVLQHNNLNAATRLRELGEDHGVARAQMQFNIEEFLAEYRLLRHVVVDEITEGGTRPLSLSHMQAITTGIDLAMEAGVIAFVQHQTDRLKEAAELESRYVSFLSHDVRNNLNSVTLMIELLSRRLAELPDLAQEAADVAHLKRSIRQTVQGMDRILQAERVRRQAMDAQFGPIELRSLVEEVIDQHHHEADQKGLTIINGVPPEARVHGEGAVLSLALQNLLGNAIKYSDSGTITIAAEPNGDLWHLYVQDQGVGIAPDHLRRLFQAFSRGETHGKSGVGGPVYRLPGHPNPGLGTEGRIRTG